MYCHATRNIKIKTKRGTYYYGNISLFHIRCKSDNVNDDEKNIAYEVYVRMCDWQYANIEIWFLVQSIFLP